jgi:hypothetical protein
MARIKKCGASVKVAARKMPTKKMLKSMIHDLVDIGTKHDINLSKESKTILKEHLLNDINIVLINKSDSNTSSSFSDTVSGFMTGGTTSAGDSITRSSDIKPNIANSCYNNLGRLFDTGDMVGAFLPGEGKTCPECDAHIDDIKATECPECGCDLEEDFEEDYFIFRWV